MIVSIEVPSNIPSQPISVPSFFGFGTFGFPTLAASNMGKPLEGILGAAGGPNYSGWPNPCVQPCFNHHCLNLLKACFTQPCKKAYGDQGHDVATGCAQECGRADRHHGLFALLSVPRIQSKPVLGLFGRWWTLFTLISTIQKRGTFLVLGHWKSRPH